MLSAEAVCKVCGKSLVRFYIHNDKIIYTSGTRDYKKDSDICKQCLKELKEKKSTEK